MKNKCPLCSGEKNSGRHAKGCKNAKKSRSASNFFTNKEDMKIPFWKSAGYESLSQCVNTITNNENIKIINKKTEKYH